MKLKVQMPACNYTHMHTNTQSSLSLLPKVEVIIGECVIVILKHVIVFHGLLDARLVGGYGLWHSLEVVSLFCEVLNGIGTLTKFV